MTRTKRQTQLRANRTGPFPPGNPGALNGRMALDHQDYKGGCVVHPLSQDRPSTPPSTSPLALGNLGLIDGRMALNHQLCKGSCVVSSPILPPEASEASMSQHPPTTHTSRTDKKMARLHRKLDCSNDVWILPTSISLNKIKSTKPIQILPNYSRPRNLITSSGGIPHFILERHPFKIRPPTPTFQQLSDVIKTLYHMAQHRPTNTMNSQRLGGEMRMIGFRCASDKNKSGGTYVRNKLTPEQEAKDNQLWQTLQSHNNFLACRMESLSSSAYQDNQSIMSENGIPNWSQEEWTEMRNETQVEYKFASNVSVTFDDFYNKAHQDGGDLNGWTYGIFSFIDRKTGEPIPPPHSKEGHGFLFPRHPYLIDFVHANGIVELVWQTTQFEHHTTKPPPHLPKPHLRYWTHFGFSFQINKKLANVALALKGKSQKVIHDATLCKHQRSIPK